MTRRTWINRRGQTGVDAAIELVIGQQAQLDEQIQQIADTLIEDSPYQARQPFSDESIADLVQAMSATSFQGVLVVRVHKDSAKQRRGFFQLVYGHRRRVAWRRVCAEQGTECTLPVVVRSITDEQMLTIGAQENLQRQDLNPIEEAQLVAWHEQIFADKNQAEIGAMLGKSSDWVSTRSRIHRLPDELKVRLKERPRAIAQILELGSLFIHSPEATIKLADQVVDESLSLNALRSQIRGYARPERRGAATSVQKITAFSDDEDQETIREVRNNQRGGATLDNTSNQELTTDGAFVVTNTIPTTREANTTGLELLEHAAESLTLVASRVQSLPAGRRTLRAVSQCEEALGQLRQVLVLQSDECDQ